jgi:glutamate N-acetyltransferase/amino-acid N-acetyltransferase
MAGMTKGSGMIQPNMATTLGFVITDAVVSPVALRAALEKAIDRSYNRISVDGDTSTNDMVAVLANGASGVKPPAKAFEAALTAVLESLAKQIARDGEGAKKLVTIDVEGARNEADAARIARSIAHSPLVKSRDRTPIGDASSRPPDIPASSLIHARRISTCRASRCAAEGSRRISRSAN